VNGFLIIIALGALFIWLAFVRPQKRQQQQQQVLWEGLEIGDEVVTAGGIYGEITAFDGDNLVVRIAPDVEVRVARRAIGGVVPRPAEDEEAEETEDAEEDGKESVNESDSDATGSGPEASAPEAESYSGDRK
jgi:preprotein translocase subunit YajC